jgi:hypothetical protein
MASVGPSRSDQASVLASYDVFDYFETLPEKSLQRLYEKPATCLAVFR